MKKLFLLCALIALVVLPGIAYPATIWYMPEGCTRGFDLWVLVTNPNSSTANITYTFYTANNGTFTHTETIAANARLSIHVNAKINAAAGSTIEDDVSTKVECTNGLNVYAERAMYWPQGGSVSGTWVGGHTSRAVSGGEGCYTEIGQPISPYSSDKLIYITNPGSYKLISNIDLSASAWSGTALTNTDGIYIAVSNVTLDLNGFSIIGPGFNVGSTGNGVVCIGISNNKICNGMIRNFRENGIYLDSVYNTAIKDLQISYNGLFGCYIYYWMDINIQDCILLYNGFGSAGVDTGGVYIKGRSVLMKDNNCNFNRGFGILIDTNSYYNFIERNIVSDTKEQTVISNQAGICVRSDDNRIEGNHSIGNYNKDIILSGTNNACVFNSYENGRSDFGAGNTTSIADNGNMNL